MRRTDGVSSHNKFTQWVALAVCDVKTCRGSQVTLGKSHPQVPKVVEALAMADSEEAKPLVKR